MVLRGLRRAPRAVLATERTADQIIVPHPKRVAVLYNSCVILIARLPRVLTN